MLRGRGQEKHRAYSVTLRMAQIVSERRESKIYLLNALYRQSVQSFYMYTGTVLEYTNKR